jgi:hypothetical protein|tara:strand:+ start:336 stop:2165 length:1830 start_codon:yes stop_codon:yes gene_type:complete
MQIKDLRVFLGSKKGMYLIVSLILLLHFLFVISSAWNTSPTVDLSQNIDRGYKFFSQGIIANIVPANTGQAHLFGLSPIILGIELDEKTWFLSNFKSGNNKGLLAYHDMLDKNEMNIKFYEGAKKAQKEDILRKILRVSILIEAIISVLTAFVVFLWAKQAFRLKSGYIALLLYSFSPFVTSLVHGLHGDNLVRFLTILTFFYLWRFITFTNKKDLIFTGVSLGAAMVIKPTTAFYPILLSIILIGALFMNDSFKSKIKTLFRVKWSNKYINVIAALLLIGITAVFVINGMFLFKDVFKPMSEYNYEHHQISSEFFLSLKNSFLGAIPLPISPYWILSIDSGKFISEGAGSLFFMGEYFLDIAPKSFYLVSFLVKTTTPVLILFLIVHLLLILILLSKNNEKMNTIKFNFIYLLFIIYFIFLFTTIATKQVAGLRHLGVIYPFIFIIISSIISIKFPFSKYIKTFILVLVIWHIIIYLFAYPFFIPYFNEMVGKNNGYLYFRDTNIDYHELYYHAIEYKKSNLEVILFPPCVIEKGKVSMSPNDLNFQRANCYGWLKNFEPVDFIGNSWPVYDIEGKWVQENDGQIRFVPSEKMKPRKAKINSFLKWFI